MGENLWGKQTAGRSKTKQADHWKPFGRNPLSFPKSSLATTTTRRVKLVMKLQIFLLELKSIKLQKISNQHVSKITNIWQLSC